MMLSLSMLLIGLAASPSRYTCVAHEGRWVCSRDGEPVVTADTPTSSAELLRQAAALSRPTRPAAEPAPAVLRAPSADAVPLGFAPDPAAPAETVSAPRTPADRAPAAVRSEALAARPAVPTTGAVVPVATPPVARAPVARPPTSALPSGAYTVQLIAGASRSSLEPLIRAAQDAGWSTEVIESERNGAPWYQLVTGRYADAAAARSALAALPAALAAGGAFIRTL